MYGGTRLPAGQKLSRQPIFLCCSVPNDSLPPPPLATKLTECVSPKIGFDGTLLCLALLL
ncbi:MAG: hypothetical protein JWP84_4991 [Tardiphaga sp.]|jgi:hypothetical protein|nr:hypothetical protein [Tardiphaga sp.]